MKKSSPEPGDELSAIPWSHLTNVDAILRVNEHYLNSETELSVGLVAQLSVIYQALQGVIPQGEPPCPLLTEQSKRASDTRFLYLRLSASRRDPVNDSNRRTLRALRDWLVKAIAALNTYARRV